MSERNRPAAALDDVVALARQQWREDAACAGARLPDGSAAPFVDPPDLEVAEYLIRRWCHRCDVLSDCNAWADTVRPEPWLSVYGGRVRGIKAPRKRKAS